jgi:hypothetical protein
MIEQPTTEENEFVQDPLDTPFEQRAGLMNPEYVQECKNAECNSFQELIDAATGLFNLVSMGGHSHLVMERMAEIMEGETNKFPDGPMKDQMKKFADCHRKTAAELKKLHGF